MFLGPRRSISVAAVLDKHRAAQNRSRNKYISFPLNVIPIFLGPCVNPGVYPGPTMENGVSNRPTPPRKRTEMRNFKSEANFKAVFDTLVKDHLIHKK
jgi:hypothetical protein